MADPGVVVVSGYEGEYVGAMERDARLMKQYALRVFDIWGDYMNGDEFIDRLNDVYASATNNQYRRRGEEYVHAIRIEDQKTIRIGNASIPVIENRSHEFIDARTKIINNTFDRLGADIGWEIHTAGGHVFTLDRPQEVTWRSRRTTRCSCRARRR